MIGIIGIYCIKSWNFERNGCFIFYLPLILKAPITTAADNILIFFFIIYQKK